MKLFNSFAVLAFASTTMGCVPATSNSDTDPITAAVSGRTLTLGSSRLDVGADGTLTGVIRNGDELVGTWSVQNGQWCRTIVQPTRLAGSECQNASVGNGTFTVDGLQGPLTWQIE